MNKWEKMLSQYVSRDIIRDSRTINSGDRIADYTCYPDGVVHLDISYGYYESDTTTHARVEFTRPTTEKEKADYDRFSALLKKQREREAKARQDAEKQKENQERQLLAKLKKKYESKL